MSIRREMWKGCVAVPHCADELHRARLKLGSKDAAPTQVNPSTRGEQRSHRQPRSTRRATGPWRDWTERHRPEPRTKRLLAELTGDKRDQDRITPPVLRAGAVRRRRSASRAARAPAEGIAWSQTTVRMRDRLE